MLITMPGKMPGFVFHCKNGADFASGFYPDAKSALLLMFTLK